MIVEHLEFLIAGPTPRKLKFGGKQRAAKKRLVLEDSDDDEDATMPDADSEELSGSEYEAKDADDASSSEDEEDSAADASDEVLCAMSHVAVYPLSRIAAVSSLSTIFMGMACLQWHAICAFAACI